ncbi:hypothetical protein A2U01_0088882, partial [Trifolium medium]|nr:hypothetical protein [Trifolium medium]
MVIIKEISDEARIPLGIPPVGYELETQIRSHYTRAKGTVNYEGYFSEMFGFPVSSSDSDTESDISNDRSSDCVII